MGGTESSSTSDLITELSYLVAQETYASCVTTGTQQQGISAVGVSGDVSIGGVSMAQSASINVDCVLSAEKQSDLLADIANTITQNAEALGIGLLSALGSTEAEVSTNIYNMLSTEVNQSSVQESINSYLQTQNIIVKDVGGNVDIQDITMEQGAELIASAVIADYSMQSAINTVSAVIDQSASAEEENPIEPITDALTEIVGDVTDSYMYTIIAVAFVIIAIVIGLLVFVFKGGAKAVKEVIEGGCGTSYQPPLASEKQI